MVKSYMVTCNLFEIQKCMEKVLDIVRDMKCFGYSGTGDTVTFHFPARGQATMVFLQLEGMLDNVSVETSAVFINKNKLKGIF